MLRRVDGTREAIATITVTNYLDTERRLLITEGGCRLEVDGIPSKLDERLTAIDSVPAKNIRGPIALWLLGCTPDTAIFWRNTGRVHVEARIVVLVSRRPVGGGRWVDLLSRGASPILRARNSQRSGSLDIGRDQHSFIPWQDSLTNGDVARGFVATTNIAAAIRAVGLIGKWFLDLTTLVAEESSVLYRDQSESTGSRVNAYHGLWIAVRRRLGVPLH